MSEPLKLANWRRFPRARLCLGVIFQDGARTWSSHTRDISLGGCRIAGYYPFPIGKVLSLQFKDFTELPLAVTGHVARLYGGSQNSFGLVFDEDAHLLGLLQGWMQKLARSYPGIKKTLTRTPEHLPVTAWLRRTTLEDPGRALSSGEIDVLQRIERARPIQFLNLRRGWGNDWERRAQALFELIADGMVAFSVPTSEPKPLAPSVATEDFSVRSMIFKSKDLLKALEREYGPLDKSFALELEEISREVFGGKKDRGSSG